MKNLLNATILTIALTAFTTITKAQTNNVADALSASKNHTTLVTALKTADLVTTLKGKGPFTIFAPTNAAFDKLPAGTLDNLLKKQNKAVLKKILTYHVIAGNIKLIDILTEIKKNNGTTTLTTVQGEIINISIKDGKLFLAGAKGSTASVVVTDLAQSNGTIHEIDAVLMPK